MGKMTRRQSLLTSLALGLGQGSSLAAYLSDSKKPLRTGQFRWSSSAALIHPASHRDDPCHAIKDPSIVYFQNSWHLFCTIRCQKRTHQIEYLTFDDWDRVALAKRTILSITDGYYCAPQIFYYVPESQWYLLFQMVDSQRKPQLQPAYATSKEIANLRSWSKPQLLFDREYSNIQRWIDFWIIGDDDRMHLFFTSLDGRMWRCDTPRSRFPRGWNQPKIVLQGNLFEASHTYRLDATNQYLTIVEAQEAQGRRFYQAYLADRLDGNWSPLATTRELAFASPTNVTFQSPRWTDSFSHGELLRSGHDETMKIDATSTRFLYQGVLDADRTGKPYGQIPWKLGLLSSS